MITTHYQQRVQFPERTPDSFEFLDAAHRGGRPYVSVILRCNEGENVRRLMARIPGTTTKLKAEEKEILLNLRGKHVLYSFLDDHDRNPEVAGEIVIDIDQMDCVTAAHQIRDLAVLRASEWRQRQSDMVKKGARSALNEGEDRPKRYWPFNWS